MSEKDLDALLDRMKSIAQAVNAFTSETVQQSAFTALVAAFNGGSASQPLARHTTPKEEPIEPKDDDGAAAAGGKLGSRKGPKRKNAGSAGKDFQLVKDLDLRPAGKKSFADFVAEKQPSTNEDKYAVAVYYLQHVLELPAVTTNHVGTIFRLEPTWREPADLPAGLRMTSTRKGTIDTASSENLKMTAHGRNFVEHDLPPKQRANKK